MTPVPDYAIYYSPPHRPGIRKMYREARKNIYNLIRYRFSDALSRRLTPNEASHEAACATLKAGEVPMNPFTPSLCCEDFIFNHCRAYAFAVHPLLRKLQPPTSEAVH